MKYVLILLLLVLVLHQGSSMHALKHFDLDIEKVKEYHAKGDTSRVFSIFMKLLVQTKLIYQELDIIHPHIPEDTNQRNCSFMLEELVGLFHGHTWV